MPDTAAAVTAAAAAAAAVEAEAEEAEAAGKDAILALEDQCRKLEKTITNNHFLIELFLISIF